MSKLLSREILKIFLQQTEVPIQSINRTYVKLYCNWNKSDVNILNTAAINLPSLIFKTSDISFKKGCIKNSSRSILKKLDMKFANCDLININNVIALNFSKLSYCNMYLQSIYKNIFNDFKEMLKSNNFLIISFVGPLTFMKKKLSQSNKKADNPLPLVEIPHEEIKEKNVKKRNWLIQFFINIYLLFRAILRVFRLVSTFLPVFIVYPITYLGKSPKEIWWFLLLKGMKNLSYIIFI